MAEIKRGLAVPPEVTEYFDGKTLKPGFSWLDVWEEEHAYSMTVAKAIELDVLAAFRNTLSPILHESHGFEQWKPHIRAELSKLGWWQPRLVKDPTGEQPDRMVDFSSDRRLRTIFWGNASSARSAGQWERAQRSKKALPYILYIRTTSADPRPEHMAWVGLILPIDHPFWKTHWPPNGWLCKCTIRQISKFERDKLLGTDRSYGKDADGNDIRIRYTEDVPDLGPDIDFRNRRTGEISKIPPGIDPGWHLNPGQARASTLIQNLESRLAVAAPEDAVKVLKDLWEDPYLKIAPRLPEKVWLPAGHNAELAAELGAKSPVISITSEAIAERIVKHKLAVEDFAVLPDVLSGGKFRPDPKGKPNVRGMLLNVAKTWWRAFVTVSGNGYLRATSLHQVRASQAEAMMKEEE